MADCRVCGVPDKEKAMAFRGEDFCCDQHRKVITGEVHPTQKEWETMDSALVRKLGGYRCD